MTGSRQPILAGIFNEGAIVVRFRTAAGGPGDGGWRTENPTGIVLLGFCSSVAHYCLIIFSGQVLEPTGKHFGRGVRQVSMFTCSQA